MEYEHCFHQSDNSTCGVYEATYIVNDIENQGYVPSQVPEFFELNLYNRIGYLTRRRQSKHFLFFGLA